jgi:hypothetical protein
MHPLGAVAYGSLMVYSNVVTENVSGYVLTLTSSSPNATQNENVTFTATLDVNNGSGLVPAGAGCPIHFYQGSTEIDTNVTDANGIATFDWNMTNVGSSAFKAG